MARLSHSRIAEFNSAAPWHIHSWSASPVRCVTVRAEQQRNVELRLALAYTKGDFDRWVQCLGFLRDIVTCRIEGQSVKARGQELFFWQQLAAPPVLIGAGGAQHT